MRRLIATTNMTLSGVMEAPDRWSFEFYNEEMERHAHDELHASGGLLMGRVTYQEFVEYWPTATDEIGLADLMNGLPKFVASTTLEHVDWSNASLLAGDVPDAVSRLKQEPGKDLLLLASARLGATLREHDLIDEFRIAINPTVYDRGRRYFEGGSSNARLDLVDAKTISTGIVIVTYQRRRS